jgi:N-acetylneuraminic acid mutarotase
VLNNVWYAFGGWGQGGVIATVRAFDGTAWSDRLAMPTARSHAAAVVLDGKIWVIGGEEKRNVASRAVEVYDPATNKWQRRAPLRHPRALPVCGVVKNASGAARIVVAGGVSGVDAVDYGVPLRRDTVEELVP